MDALGHPLRLLVGPGQQSDYLMAQQLLSGLLARAVIADRGYDSQSLVDAIEQAGARAVIPSKKNRRRPRPIERDLYRQRNRIERFFCRLKNYRRVATRYDKTACCFLAFAHFASTIIWLQ